jgi:hypothetical protein
MTRRLAAPFALALALAAPSAFADVPPADGGTGTGGGSSTNNPNCTVSQESVSGTTCQECVISGTDTGCQDELGNDYNFVCTQSSTVEIWCNGPPRTAFGDPSGCALRAPSGSSGAAHAGLALALAAIARRRRTRA